MDASLVVALAALVLWYCVDALSASRHILNIILILPVTAVVLALCAIQLAREALRPSPPAQKVEPIGNAPTSFALFAGFVVALPWLGFDVGSCLFLMAYLWLQGERRWTWIFGYSLTFASTASLFFGAMLPYPMPMLVFPP